MSTKEEVVLWWGVFFVFRFLLHCTTCRDRTRRTSTHFKTRFKTASDLTAVSSLSQFRTLKWMRYCMRNCVWIFTWWTSIFTSRVRFPQQYALPHLACGSRGNQAAPPKPPDFPDMASVRAHTPREGDTQGQTHTWTGYVWDSRCLIKWNRIFNWIFFLKSVHTTTTSCSDRQPNMMGAVFPALGNVVRWDITIKIRLESLISTLKNCNH